jgi:Uncharacterised protein family (UPF0220)
MESKAVFVYWFRLDGWRIGGKRGKQKSYLHLKFLDSDSEFLCAQTVLILKYILNGYSEQFTYYGYANVSQNVALMLSAVVLWIAQSGSSEYEYNLTL